MIIKAKFTGSNSLGYEHGKEYELRIKNTLAISIVRLDGTGYCKYGSLPAFLKNWKEIVVVNQDI